MEPEPEPEPVRKRASDGRYAQGSPKIAKTTPEDPEEINTLKGRVSQIEMNSTEIFAELEDKIKDLEGSNETILEMIGDIYTNEYIDTKFDELDTKFTELDTKFTDEYADIRDTLRTIQGEGPPVVRGHGPPAVGAALKNKSKKRKKRRNKSKKKKKQTRKKSKK